MASWWAAFRPASMSTPGLPSQGHRHLGSSLSSQTPGQPQLNMPVVNAQRIKAEAGVGVEGQWHHRLPAQRPQQMSQRDESAMAAEGAAHPQPHQRLKATMVSPSRGEEVWVWGKLGHKEETGTQSVPLLMEIKCMDYPLNDGLI